jgi:hypothetical protein
MRTRHDVIQEAYDKIGSDLVDKLADRILELEEQNNRLNAENDRLVAEAAEPDFPLGEVDFYDKDAVDRYERDKKAWQREETMNRKYENSMMLKPFLDDVQKYQKEVLCDGKTGIASHNIPSSVHVKLFNKKTGEYTYGDVQWIEPSMMMGCGCWNGIFIIAETDE